MTYVVDLGTAVSSAGEDLLLTIAIGKEGPDVDKNRHAKGPKEGSSDQTDKVLIKEQKWLDALSVKSSGSHESHEHQSPEGIDLVFELVVGSILGQRRSSNTSDNSALDHMSGDDKVGDKQKDHECRVDFEGIEIPGRDEKVPEIPVIVGGIRSDRGPEAVLGVPVGRDTSEAGAAVVVKSVGDQGEDNRHCHGAWWTEELVFWVWVGRGTFPCHNWCWPL